MFRTVVGLGLILASVGGHAALRGRAPATPDGTNYRAYYDTALDITWVADGNLAATHDFGVSGIGDLGPGTMNWDTAQLWIAAMNSAGYLGVDNWRLTTVIDTDGPDPDALGNDGCNLAYSGTDCGWNVDPATGEIAHLYYITLDNIGGYDANGVHQDCDTGMPAPPACLTNVGPFSNFQPNHYWTGTAFAPDAANAWEFDARNGVQNIQVKSRYSYAWAVRPGDLDTDGDGVVDGQDNCSDSFNPDQLDADSDGYGNICDADLNNSGLTTTIDYNLLRGCLNQPSAASALCAAADLNGSGLVTAIDFNMLRARINTAPGPSGLIP